MSRLFAPMLAIVLRIAVDEPWPISIMAITAATPMMMPSVVSTDRRTLRRRASTASFNVRMYFFMSLPLSNDAGCSLGSPIRSRFDPPVAHADHALGVAGHFGIVRHEDNRDAFGIVERLKEPQDF